MAVVRKVLECNFLRTIASSAFSIRVCAAQAGEVVIDAVLVIDVKLGQPVATVFHDLVSELERENI